MSNLLFILLMANPEGEGNPLQMLLMFGLVILVMYFFMVRPQQKKQKELKKFREELKVGDKIITVGGIYGKISEIAESTVIIEVEGKMKLKLDKASLVRDNSDILTTQK